MNSNTPEILVPKLLDKIAKKIVRHLCQTSTPLSLSFDPGSADPPPRCRAISVHCVPYVRGTSSHATLLKPLLCYSWKIKIRNIPVWICEARKGICSAVRADLENDHM